MRIKNWAIVLTLSLSGCAGNGYVTKGGAVYEYAQQADGSCSLTATTLTDISGNKISVGDNCGLTIESKIVATSDSKVEELVKALIGDKE